MALPDHFKNLAAVFAETGLGDFFWLLHPNRNNRNLDIATQTELLRNSLHQLSDSETLPHAPHDLVPWAISDNCLLYTSPSPRDS